MVSIEGAKKNLNLELEHWDFDTVRKEAENKWENYLSRIEIEGTDEQKINFYTALYHLLIQPNNVADVNGQYKNAKDSVSLSPFGIYYSTFSLWDYLSGGSSSIYHSTSGVTSRYGKFYVTARRMPRVFTDLDVMGKRDALYDW